MLAFMRHGETDWNLAMRLQGRVDIPLNDTGRAQARKAGQDIKDDGWDLVVTSPLIRARETGSIVAQELNVELGPTYDDLMERAYGESEGQIVEGLSPAQYMKFLETAESQEEVIARGTRVVQHVREQYPGRNVLMVSHGSLIRLTVAHLHSTESRRVANAEVVMVDE